MSNQFGFLSDDTFAEKMDTMNQFLAAIATGQGGSLKPTSWSDVQALVRKGLASKVFAVGDQLTCQRGSTTLVWDIIGFDIDTPADKQFTHSMTLQLHEVFDFVQFNAPAAMYYAEEELAAGTYHVTPIETLDIVLLPTKYLMHKIRSKCSPNTVRRSALAILYYLEYIHEKKKELTDVYQMPYVEQTNHFVEFLYWLKAGKHTRDKNHRSPNNGTCNAYLRDVFRFYLFIEEEYQQFGELKVLSYNYFVAVDAVGVKKSIRSKSFKGYLKEEEHKARAAKKDEIVEILKACTNIRDRLLMLLLAETGYRIGEILGIDYSKDIDYQNHIIRVYFREDNENGARAKNAEYRSAKISKDTFGFLNLYIAEYRKLLQHQTSLFVNISGDNIGKPMNVEAVYSMLKRMDKKTGIKITPHMLRHYFGNERRKAGWSLELIQLAYGHRHIQTTINYLDIVDDELLDASQEFYEKHSSLYGIEELL